MAEKTAAKKNIFQKIGAFFKGLRAEVKKITWPDKEQVGQSTLAVVVISVVLCSIIRLIDVLAQLLINFVSSVF